MSLPLPDFVDERFLKHRLRASSTAGMTAAAFALLLGLYRYLHDGRLERDLLAVGVVVVVVKYALFFWYRRTE